MTKQEKLRSTLEQKVVELKEAWKSFEDEKTSHKDSDKGDQVIALVKLILEVVSKSNKTLDAYSVYTVYLEKKLKISQKTTRKKKYS